MRNLAVFIALLAAPSHAAENDDIQAFFDGNLLWRICSSTSEIARHRCISYTAGVLDGVLYDEAYSICIVGIDPEQVADTVKIWLRDHPEQRHHAGASAVIIAAAKAYPCPKAK